MTLSRPDTDPPLRLAADAVDHLVYATPELSESVEYISGLLDAEPIEGGSHQGRGTRNYLLGLGGRRYLEIIGPDEEQDGPDGVWPFELDQLTTPKLLNWAVAVEDLDSTTQYSLDAGYDPGNILNLSRKTPGGEVLRWRVSKLPDEKLPFSGVVPFLVEWGETPHPTSTLKIEVELTDLKAAHHEPNGVNAALGALGLQMPVTTGPASLTATIETNSGTIELR